MADAFPIGQEEDILSFPYNSEDLRDAGGGIMTNPDGIVLGDRMYDADDEANIMKLFFRNGVFPNPLADVPDNGNSQWLQVVSRHNSMVLTLRIGAGFVEGRRCIVKRDLEFPVAPSHLTMGRRDIVVLRHDLIARTCFPFYIPGVAANTPQVPTLVRNDDVWDIQLCMITVHPNALTITQANILDTRMDTSVCGFVTGLVSTVDTRTLFLQIHALVEEMEQSQANWVANFRDHWDTDQGDWVARWRQIHEDWVAQERANIEAIIHDFRLLLGQIETQLFTFINHDFDADWAKRGCKRTPDFSYPYEYRGVMYNAIRETWTVMLTGMLLAEQISIFTPDAAVVLTRFFPWEVVEGNNTIVTTAWENTQITAWNTLATEVM